MTRLILCALAAMALLHAQSPVTFECTEEDSREGGLTCSEDQPCPVYLDLTGVEKVLNRIVLAGNLHTADVTLYSILLVSEDEGSTWTEPLPRTRFTSLDQVQFIDFETGWISGANVQGVPRDPFFLITGDGGKTWNQRPIFDESRTGIVERFRFDSKTTGLMLLSTKLRHELYESNTGGDSWALRQSSTQPLKFPRDRPAADPVIRIRADAKAHTYFIEKRQADKWVNLASFPVEVGKCKF